MSSKSAAAKMVVFVSGCLKHSTGINYRWNDQQFAERDICIPKGDLVFTFEKQSKVWTAILCSHSDCSGTWTLECCRHDVIVTNDTPLTIPFDHDKGHLGVFVGTEIPVSIVVTHRSENGKVLELKASTTLP